MTLSPWRRLQRAEARLVGTAATVAGVDEAGRGPLAGPVVAAAVVLDSERRWKGFDDSKKLDPETRETLYARVLIEARAFAWAVVGSRAIDRLNIRRATLGAMAKAVARLRVQPEVVLIDGIDTVPEIGCRQHAVIDGDARMLSIAAASVVAKVVRDRIMCRLDRVYPNYGFAQHKGYGTPEHLVALDVHGPCAIHRLSYRPCGQTNLFPRFASAEALEAAADAAVEDPTPVQ